MSKSNIGANATRQFADNKDSPWTEEAVPCAWYDINLGIPDVSKKEMITVTVVKDSLSFT